MIKAFQIYKQGVTSDWITILIPENQFNDSILQRKIDWYTYLGYSIKNL